MLGGCGNTQGTYSTDSNTFFLKNSDGTYTYGEIVFPENYSEESLPLVVMSHGIYGSMNSGGAEELAQRLAASGIIAVRVDFNRFLSDHQGKVSLSDKSLRTNQYTLSEMMESNKLAIDFAVDKYDADPDRIGLYGRSFGGRLSMAMGNESYGGIDYKSMFLIAPAGNEYALIHYMGGRKEWDSLMAKAQAAEANDTICERKGLIFTPKWFEDYYRYNPALTGDKFGDKPVMLYYNTKDTVVEPETSLDCAHAYSNIEIFKVTSDNNHGYEMSFDHSELKEEIMNRAVTFFGETL